MTESEHTRMVLPASLELERVLPACPETVWEYFVDPNLRQKWFCAGDTGDKPGDPFVMDFDHTRISDTPAPEGCGDPIVIRGTIVEIQAPKRLVYDWPGSDESTATRVTIEIQPQGAHTLLRLTHERLESLEYKRGASAGWQAHTDLLADLLSNEPARDFWVRYEELKSHYDAKISE